MNHAKTGVSRRNFLGLAGIAAVAGVSAGLAGCGSGSGSGSGASSQAATTSTAAPAASTASIPSSVSTTAAARPAILVFSRADENYQVGVIEVGNTMKVAQAIEQKTGADLFELVPVEAYPKEYQACCDQAKAEQAQNARPAIADIPDLTDYDLIYLGFPCWWGDLPMPVYTAIEAIDWNGKGIAPFCTHEGSGGDAMFAKLASVCKGATVLEGLAMTGSVAQKEATTVDSNVDKWLEKLGQ